MQPQVVVYLGATIHPIDYAQCVWIYVHDDHRGVRARKAWLRHVGNIQYRRQAYQYAVAFARSEIERHRLMTLICWPCWADGAILDGSKWSSNLQPIRES
jgi:hypothetical protein